MHSVVESFFLELTTRLSGFDHIVQELQERVSGFCPGDGTVSMLMQELRDLLQTGRQDLFELECRSEENDGEGVDLIKSVTDVLRKLEEVIQSFELIFQC